MPLFDVYALYDITPTHADGYWVYTSDGRRILDCYGGHAVISIGHAHPRYVERIREQVGRLSFYSNSVQNPLQEEYAALLASSSGLPDYNLFMCNSGAEANENALKLASFVSGRKRIIAFKNAFHGRTSAAVNVTDNERIKAAINRGFPVTFLDFDDLAGVKRELAKGDVATVIIEGIQGVGGVHVPDPAFLEALPDLCHANGALLILDEIQSGFGRSGKFFAFQHANLRPDIISMAKGMGNGFPIGGILIHPRLEAWKGMLGTTFGGNHLACAAGLAVLEILKEEQLVERAAQTGAWLLQELSATGLFREVRGRGLMIGLELSVPAAPIREKLLLEHGVFTGSAASPNTLRLLPPLSIDREACELLIGALRATLEKGGVS